MAFTLIFLLLPDSTASNNIEYYGEQVHIFVFLISGMKTPNFDLQYAEHKRIGPMLVHVGLRIHWQGESR
jgi:hypothetical protein